jgi:hypothetical protein
MDQIETSRNLAAVKQAINAYRSITATNEFKEIERLRSLARHNEASALGHARRVERAKWQAVVAQKDATLAQRDAALAQKDAEIERLRAELGKT